MKININQIPPQGLTQEEEFSALSFDLETELIKFQGPLKIRARFFKGTDTLSVEAHLFMLLSASCSRCLNKFGIGLEKDLHLDYAVDKSEPIIDLSQDIRDQIILDYPLKPLCAADCKGLCPKCGKNLNEGGCSCAIT